MKNKFDYFNDIRVDFSKYKNIELTKQERLNMKRILKEKKSKRISLKKGLIIAASVSALAIGTAAIATQGTTRVISGSSLSFPTYKEIPTAEKLQKDIGITPKIVSEFSNGYKFENATKANNSIDDIVDGNTRVTVVDENGNEQKFKSISVRYTNGDNKITLNADPAEYAFNSDTTETENYNGVSIRYNAFTNKFVPGDYVQTEQDIKDEEEGKYVFSYGTEDIEIHKVQGVSWTQDGIYYHINAMDSPMGEQDLIAMAKELIDFK